MKYVGNAPEIAKKNRIIQEIVHVTHLTYVKIYVSYVRHPKNYVLYNMVMLEVTCALRVISVVNPVVFFPIIANFYVV